MATLDFACTHILCCVVVVFGLPLVGSGEEGGGKSSRENKLLKQRFLQSSIIQDLKNEYLDTPEELRVSI